MARRGGGAILPDMNRSADRPASPAQLKSFRCGTCGYGSARRSAPHRCPMCGGTNWQEERRKLYAELDESAVRIDEAADEDASAPLQQEAWEIDAASIFPGIPFN